MHTDKYTHGLRQRPEGHSVSILSSTVMSTALYALLSAFLRRQLMTERRYVQITESMQNFDIVSQYKCLSIIPFMTAIASNYAGHIKQHFE